MMSGAAQVVYTLLAAGQGFIPGNLNFVAPDERTKGLKINPETLSEKMEFVLCNAAGFGGTNSCLVVRIAE